MSNVFMNQAGILSGPPEDRILTFAIARRTSSSVTGFGELSVNGLNYGSSKSKGDSKRSRRKSLYVFAKESGF